MDRSQLESTHPASSRRPLTDTVEAMVEMILTATDDTDDLWEVGDRLDSWVAEHQLV